MWKLYGQGLPDLRCLRASTEHSNDPQSGAEWSGLTERRSVCSRVPCGFFAQTSTFWVLLWSSCSGRGADKLSAGNWFSIYAGADVRLGALGKSRQ